MYCVLFWWLRITNFTLCYCINGVFSQLIDGDYKEKKNKRENNEKPVSVHVELNGVFDVYSTRLSNIVNSTNC